MTARTGYYMTIETIEGDTVNGKIYTMRLRLHRVDTDEVVRNIDISAPHNSLHAWTPTGVAPGSEPHDVALDGVSPQGSVHLPYGDVLSATSAAVACPKCGSAAYEGDGVDIEGASCTQRCRCNSCECEWVVDYMAVIVTIIE